MPDGNIYSFPTYYDPEFLSLVIGFPLWINDEWLEELGMEEPETTEEFYQYLKAVKETDLLGDGSGNEVPLSASSVNGIVNQLRGSWGLGNKGQGNSYIDLDPETNELRFIRTDDRYKEVLEYVHKLYAEGLIDQDIYTHETAEFYAKGASGALGAVNIGNPIAVMDQEQFVGLAPLEGPYGDRLQSQIRPPLAHIGSFAITDKNEHPEATVRWMDYFYSDEGAKLFFMGIEGETFEETEDGQYVYVDEILDNPDGLTQDQALANTSRGWEEAIRGLSSKTSSKAQKPYQTQSKQVRKLVHTFQMRFGMALALMKRKEGF